MERRFVCADCGKTAPKDAEDSSSLITIKYGWRFRRNVDANGASKLEARCPECHARRRASEPPR
jgi:hypothetical protein